ncbi:hypothetical protein [Rhizobium sp. BK491]|uniref:hypothetical protein n=1 Tax=Rhizobium sp. BK491 TaxID=2587009 RepID=UPI0016137A2F|nr:hypothetical protein [Rhizobium sp. BK491]MBB3567215.1 putative nucleic acid-binding protein [Rhizobium sp. BK491]
MPFSPNAASVYADGPTATPLQPSKPEIRAYLLQLEAATDAIAAGAGTIAKQTLAQLNGDLAHSADTMAWVYADGNVTNNGIYRKNGGSGSGSWSFALPLPYTYIAASNSGTGTQNAIKATSTVPVTNGMLVSVNVTVTNTGTPVTIAFNNQLPLTIKTRSGLDIGAGDLTPGYLLGVRLGSIFYLLSDVAVASLIYAARDAAYAARDAAQLAQSRAEDAQHAAEEARDIAAGYASDAVSQGNVPIYATAVGLAGLAIPNGITFIRTNGYYSANGKGAALYRQVMAPEVARPGEQTSNGGTKRWGLAEAFPDAYMFGGFGDGVADDWQPLQKLLDYWSPVKWLPTGTITDRPSAMSGGGRVRIPAGVWRFTKTLYSGPFVRIYGDGMAMFPQSPMDASTYGQYSFPNATILRPDFVLADRALGVGLHVAPWVLNLTGGSAGLAGQTVGTQFKSLSATAINGPDIDNQKISYCEGADVSDLTIWPINEIFAGIRWTAATKSNLSKVGIRNVRRGVFVESCWESNIQKSAIYDFGDYGIYGQFGNLHSFGIRDNWIHAAGRVLAGDKPLGVFAGYFNGLSMDANAIDECFDAIKLENGAGAVIDNTHSERTLNVWLTTNGSFGVSGHGNHGIYNVVDARTYANSIIWDGVSCDVELNFTANIDGISSGAAFPGKTYLLGTNPNTGAQTSLNYANGATVHTTVIFKGMPKLAADANRVNRSAGRIAFEFETNTIEIAGMANANQALTDTLLYGDAGVAQSGTVYINGVAAGYVTWASDGMQVHNSAGALSFGYSNFNNYNRFLFAGGLSLQAVFGNPNTFRTEAKGSLVADTANGALWITMDASSSSAWRSIGDVDLEYTSATLGSATNAVNTTNKRKGMLVYNTTNTHVYRALGASATAAWVSLRDGTTITPA